MPEGAVYVGRPTKWGNPWPITAQRSSEDAVTLYRQHLCDHPDLVDAAGRELAGRDLVCWCRPDQACHADVLLDVANRR